MREFLERWNMSASDVQPRIPPENVVQLSAAEVTKFRSVAGVRLPSINTVQKLKIKWATLHGTETQSFNEGAYITDPIKFIAALSKYSEYIVVGADAGGGSTKLGIIYTTKYNTQQFAPLLAYTGTDDYSKLSQFNVPGKLTFTGESAAYPTIYAALNQVIAGGNVLLVGDLALLNAIMGLKACGSRNPCSRCVAYSSNLSAPPAQPRHYDTLEYSGLHPPLLNIPVENIITAPLHCFINLGNRILLYFDRVTNRNGSLVEVEVAKVKTYHGTHNNGNKDRYELNGRELQRFIKDKIAEIILTHYQVQRSTRGHEFNEKSFLTADKWLSWLYNNLLHARKWTEEELVTWRGMVEEITSEWSHVIGGKSFPALHSLLHSVEIGAKFGYVGRVSEAPIEAYHVLHNNLFNERHKNQGRNKPERHRRCLADSAVISIALVVD
jgi:hypothetical protein